MRSSKQVFVNDPEYAELIKEAQRVTDNMRDMVISRGAFSDPNELWKAWARHQGALELLRALHEYRKETPKG